MKRIRLSEWKEGLFDRIHAVGEGSEEVGVNDRYNEAVDYVNNLFETNIILPKDTLIALTMVLIQVDDIYQYPDEWSEEDISRVKKLVSSGTDAISGYIELWNDTDDGLVDIVDESEPSDLATAIIGLLEKIAGASLGPCDDPNCACNAAAPADDDIVADIYDPVVIPFDPSNGLPVDEIKKALLDALNSGAPMASIRLTPNRD